MNQQHYLPIELSKLVHEKVPTLETDMSWKTTTFIDGIKSKPFLAKGIQGHNFVTRTYRLDDLMRALVELGKVKGWDIEDRKRKWGEYVRASVESFGLLRAFIADNLRLDGPNVREFISKTFV